MKHFLLTTIAAVLVVGCATTQQPELPTAKAPDILIIDATKAGNIEAVKQHLAAGTDVNAKDYVKRTPLHFAAYNGHKEVAELLITKGADVNAKDDWGRTPLDRADDETADLLREHGGKSGVEFSIHVAAELGNAEAVKQHLDAGVNVNAKHDNGVTPLHRARTKEIAELLIANGADVNAKNKHGSTPLHPAAYNGHKEVAELLITAGADVNAKEKRGKTPLDTVIQYEDPKTTDLLRKHGGKTGEELKAEGK